MNHPVIDVHVHPAFIEDICTSDEQLALCRDVFGLYKLGRCTLEEILVDNDCAGIDKVVLLPLDVTTTHGGAAATNEGVRNLVDTAPDRFIGFASVDPHRPDALEVLEYAFRDLELKGLKLHPPRQAFHPDGPELRPLYELCVKYDRPIIFHSGVSMEPGTSAKYAHPMNFESVAREIPELRFCLAHFGWPWVRETCMLLLKYPNVYADTALWYFDTPEEFYEQVFTKDMGSHWIDRSFRHQVMFGSDAPRFGALRLIEALRDFDMRESSRELILGGNAARFLGG